MATNIFKIAAMGKPRRGWRLATCEELQHKEQLETVKGLLGAGHHGVKCQLADGQYCSPGYSFHMNKTESTHMIIVKLDQDEEEQFDHVDIALEFKLYKMGNPPPGWEIATYDDVNSYQEIAKAMLSKTGPKYKIKLADGRVNVKKQQFLFESGEFGTNFRHMLIVRELGREFCLFKDRTVKDNGWYAASMKDVEENWDEVKKAFESKNVDICRLSNGMLGGPATNFEVTKGKFVKSDFVLKMRDGAVPPILSPGRLETRWWQRVLEYLVKVGVEAMDILKRFHGACQQSVQPKTHFQFEKVFLKLPGKSLSYIESLEYVTQCLQELSLRRRQHREDYLELQDISQQADRLWRTHLNRVTKHGERLRDLRNHLPKDHPDITETNTLLQTCAVVTRHWEKVVNGIASGLGRN